MSAIITPRLTADSTTVTWKNDEVLLIFASQPRKNEVWNTTVVGRFIIVVADFLGSILARRTIDRLYCRIERGTSFAVCSGWIIEKKGVVRD